MLESGGMKNDASCRGCRRAAGLKLVMEAAPEELRVRRDISVPNEGEGENEAS